MYVSETNTLHQFFSSFWWDLPEIDMVINIGHNGGLAIVCLDANFLKYVCILTICVLRLLFIFIHTLLGDVFGEFASTKLGLFLVSMGTLQCLCSTVHTFYCSSMSFALCVLNTFLHCLVSITLPYVNNLGDFLMFALLYKLCIFFAKINMPNRWLYYYIIHILSPSSASRSTSSAFLLSLPFFKSGLTRSPRRVRCR